MTLNRADAATVLAALILAIEAKPRGQTVEDRANIKRIALAILDEQVKETIVT